MNLFATLPVVCGLCRATVPMKDTKIHEEPILRCNDDGSPKPVFHGMATVREFRICSHH